MIIDAFLQRPQIDNFFVILYKFWLNIVFIL